MVSDYSGSVLNEVTYLQNVAGGTFIRTVFTSSEGADTVKAFVWESLDGMTPACDAYVLNVEQKYI